MDVFRKLAVAVVAFVAFTILAAVMNMGLHRELWPAHMIDKSLQVGLMFTVIWAAWMAGKKWRSSR